MYSIGNAPFRGVWVSCGDRCETATPTEAGAETNLTAYRLMFTLHGYIITVSYGFCNCRLTNAGNWGILICERVANLKMIGKITVNKIIKCISPIIAAVLILLSLCACADIKTAESGKIKIVCTVFPIYDWTREIASDKAEIIWLTEGGTDMHSFQPSAADMVKIAECDILIYIGGESDKWVDEAAKQYQSEKRTIVNLTSLLGDSLKEEEHTEGMEEEHKHEEETEYDEHIWLSLKNADLFSGAIADALAYKDPQNAEFYKENARNYTEKLTALDGGYQKAVSEAKNKTLLFADRFPFRYLTEDYGLSYYAAFPGCSAETEASFETVAFLSAKADELGLKYIIKTETAGTKIAETVIANTKEKNQQIMELDSMQSVGIKDAMNGTTYLSVMEKNLETLKKALGE